MSNQPGSDYFSNVFINCPFDEFYKPLFHAMVFSIFACGFIPRCALEFEDSDDVRINKIMELIGWCKYGVHDLSRLQDPSGLPRFNMPLELGIFIGCKRFGDKAQRDKKYLILEKERFRFQRFVSDLSGQDIKFHEENDLKIIGCIRDWLGGRSRRTIPHASKIAEKYQQFVNELPVICAQEEWTVEELSFPEYSSLVTAWLIKNQA